MDGRLFGILVIPLGLVHFFLVGSQPVIVSGFYGPWLFGTTKPVSDILHVAGELIVVASVICMGEPLRLGRYLNVLTGLALAVLPWFFAAPMLAAINATICGLLIAALAIPRGPKRETYGDWDRFVR